jgi:hypothetical protein
MERRLRCAAPLYTALSTRGRNTFWAVRNFRIYGHKSNCLIPIDTGRGLFSYCRAEVTSVSGYPIWIAAWQVRQLRDCMPGRLLSPTALGLISKVLLQGQGNFRIRVCPWSILSPNRCRTACRRSTSRLGSTSFALLISVHISYSWLFSFLSTSPTWIGENESMPFVTKMQYQIFESYK